MANLCDYCALLLKFTTFTVANKIVISSMFHLKSSSEKPLKVRDAITSKQKQVLVQQKKMVCDRSDRSLVTQIRYISVNHFFIEQLSQGTCYNKYCRFCTFTYNPENFIPKFHPGQKLLPNFAFLSFRKKSSFVVDSNWRHCSELSF